MSNFNFSSDTLMKEMGFRWCAIFSTYGGVVGGSGSHVGSVGVHKTFDATQKKPLTSCILFSVILYV